MAEVPGHLKLKPVPVVTLQIAAVEDTRQRSQAECQFGKSLRQALNISNYQHLTRLSLFKFR
jgi:hypothetical protein